MASHVVISKTSMGAGYQKRDWEVIDYCLFKLRNTRRLLRGPAPRSYAPGSYVAFLGAAQVFGCFCQKPFATLCHDWLRIETLNLGLPGAGPRDYLRNPPLLDCARNAKVAVIQIMSGRSIANSVFDNPHGGQLIRRDAPPGTKTMLAEKVWQTLMQELTEDEIRSLVEETQKNWVVGMDELLRAIEGPKILLWFSRRGLDFTFDTKSVGHLFGTHPQMVTRWMVESITPLANHFVECISDCGLPQPLVSRFTGAPVNVFPWSDLADHNVYYPSPEMQLAAAQSLIPVLQKYL